MATAMEMLSALKTCLSGLGSAFTGRDATAIGTDAVFPVATLTIQRDDLVGEATDIEASNPYQLWTRHLMLEVVVDDAGNWDAALDAAWIAVRRQLANYPHPLRMGGATFFRAESGSNRSVLQVPLSFDYELNLLT
ncbi:MAG: hypothetical protein P9E88_14845 [Candidatus Competibacter sp.]|nr:hypothetical protein [Candidatus Competibacter sp.]